MRKTVEPPPAARCEHCGGLLSLKRVDVAQSARGLVRQLYICRQCNTEQAFDAPRDDYAPRSNMKYQLHG